MSNVFARIRSAGVSLALVASVSVAISAPPAANAVPPSGPTITNIPSSAQVTGYFTPTVVGQGDTKVVSLTPSVCSANYDGTVSYLRAGTCVLLPQSKIPTTTVGSGFVTPYDVAVNGAGDRFIADGDTGQIVKVAADGTQTIFASGFDSPQGIALDTAGNLYVSDTGRCRVVKLSPAGAQIGQYDGFSFPRGLTVDGHGNLFVANANANQIVKITPAGTRSLIGVGFLFPIDVSVDGSGNVYVVDEGNNQVVKVSPNAGQLTIVGGLGMPSAVVRDVNGNVYVSAMGWNAVLRVGRDGNPVTFASGVSAPRGLAIDSSSDVYIADSSNHRVLEVFPTISGAAQSFVVTRFAPSASYITNIPKTPAVNTVFFPTLSQSSDGNPVVTSLTPSVCTVALDPTTGAPLVSLIGSTVATCALTSQVAAGTYVAGVNGVTQRFIVRLGVASTPMISNIPSSPTLGDSFSPTVSTSGDGAISTVSLTPNVCPLTGGVVSFIALGQCTLQSTVATSTNYWGAVGFSQSFMVTRATPTAPMVTNLPTTVVAGSVTPTVISTTSDGVVTLHTATPYACTIGAGNTIRAVNFTQGPSRTCTVVATVASTQHYVAATGSNQSVTVTPQTP